MVKSIALLAKLNIGFQEVFGSMQRTLIFKPYFQALLANTCGICISGILDNFLQTYIFITKDIAAVASVSFSPLY
jgi:hypothetical protein